MPGGNGTGPAGFGPMTGRAAGHCAGYAMPGYMNNFIGRGFWGRGYFDGGGRGRGYRHRFYATSLPGWMRVKGYDSYYGFPQAGGDEDTLLSKEDEIRYLKEQADHFKKAADDIAARLNELENNQA